MEHADDPLYREFLLDHYRNPKNKRIIEHADIHRKDSNPLCGDSIEIFIKLGDGNKIEDISFQGSGCVISTVSASLLLDELKGKRLEDVEKMSREDMLKLLGLELTPSRVKCAMLALSTIKKGIFDKKSDK